MKKSFIAFYVFFSVYHTEEGDQFDFSKSQSSSVEFLYYQDGFLVVHYWLSSLSTRGLRDVTLTAADIDPSPPFPLPLSSHTHTHTHTHTHLTQVHTYTQVDGIRIKRFVFDTNIYIIYNIGIILGWLDCTGIRIYFEVEQK